MAKLLIIYDPNDKITGCPTDVQRDLGVKEARLPIQGDLDDVDIYTVARKLAELLLEQLS